MKNKTKATRRSATKRSTGKRLMGVRPIALLELIIFFAVAGAIDFLLLGGARFQGFNPHPFWLPVIFLSIQYGTNEGLLAAFAATAMLLIGNLPEQKLSQDLYTYALEISLQPILWQAAAVVVGELHGRQVRDRDTLRQVLADTRAEKDMVAAAYLKLRGVKDTLEIRVAAQVNTLSTTYRAARSLKGESSAAVYAGLSQFVHGVLAPEKFSFFQLTERGLETKLTGGWAPSDEYAKVIAPGLPLYHQIVHDKGTLNAADPQQQSVLDGQGILAGAVRCGGNVVGMLKVEALDFASLNSATVTDFQVVCDWISDALTIAAAQEAAGGADRTPVYAARQVA